MKYDGKAQADGVQSRQAVFVRCCLNIAVRRQLRDKDSGC